MIWFTADLHFGHANIIDYCDRPFADVDEMNAELINHWNEVVEPDDVVWVLGDVAMGKIADTLPLVSRLHGHKHLVSGNHDRCWPGHGLNQAVDWMDRYKAAGFETIQPAVELMGAGWAMHHFPYAPGNDARYVEWHPRDRGGWLLHGHVHGAWVMKGRQINVGVDAWDYYPVSVTQIEQLIRTHPQGVGIWARHGW